MAPTDSTFDDRLFDRYGGVCLFDNKFDYSELVENLNSIIPFPVYIVNNVNFNAQAITKNSSRAIGIFTGLLNTCHEEVSNFMSSWQARPSELRDNRKVDGIQTWRWHWNDLDHQSLSAHSCLLQCMVLFLVAHEVAHLLGGHHRIVADHGDSEIYTEFPAFAMSREHAQLRRAIELDADCAAARSSLRLWRMISQSFGRVPIFDASSSDEFWLAAICFFFHLADRCGRVSANRQLDTHPTPGARLNQVVAQATFDPLIVPLLDLQRTTTPLVTESIRYFDQAPGDRLIALNDPSPVADELEVIWATLKVHAADLGRERDRISSEMKLKAT